MAFYDLRTELLFEVFLTEILLIEVFYDLIEQFLTNLVYYTRNMENIFILLYIIQNNILYSHLQKKY